MFLPDERRIQEVFGYDVYGIPSGGVTVVGAKGWNPWNPSGTTGTHERESDIEMGCLAP